MTAHHEWQEGWGEMALRPFPKAALSDGAARCVRSLVWRAARRRLVGGGGGAAAWGPDLSSSLTGPFPPEGGRASLSP